jgi:hypothetical protein
MGNAEVRENRLRSQWNVPSRANLTAKGRLKNTTVLHNAYNTS